MSEKLDEGTFAEVRELAGTRFKKIGNKWTSKHSDTKFDSIELRQGVLIGKQGQKEYVLNEDGVPISCGESQIKIEGPRKYKGVWEEGLVEYEFIPMRGVYVPADAPICEEKLEENRRELPSRVESALQTAVQRNQ